jgi:hypothetical protein
MSCARKAELACGQVMTSSGPDPAALASGSKWIGASASATPSATAFAEGPVASDVAYLKGTGTLGMRGSGAPQVISGAAAPKVEHVVIVLSGGTRVRVRAVQAGIQKYFAFAVASTRMRLVRWMAYDRSRHGVAAGRVA